MPIAHLLLILLIVVVWGLNFMFVKLGLNECPPFMLCAIRFFLASVPAIFFLKRPEAPFRLVALYGLVMFAMQFSFIFLGMYLGMTAGMTSIVMQTQVFFSMFFAAYLLKEQLGLPQLIGALVAFIGIAIVGVHMHTDFSLAGFICILAGSISWGFANLITKKLHKVNMMSLVVWGSFVATLPMLLLSLIFEGIHTFENAYQSATFVGVGSLLYIVFMSTWLGYGIWNWLLSRHLVSNLVPFTLLVPVVGVLSSVIFLGESLEMWKLLAGVLVLSGLCIHLVGTRISALRLASNRANA